MANKFEEFWNERLDIVRDLVDQTKKMGSSDRADVSGLKSIAELTYWNGLALINRNKVCVPSSEHVAALANIVAENSLLEDDNRYFLIVVDCQLKLRISRMNWKAHSKAHSGSGALPYSQVAVLEEITVPFCLNLEGKGQSDFSVDDFDRWVRHKYPNVKTLKGDRGKDDLQGRYPNHNVLNVRDACYHLSHAKHWWIESLNSGKEVVPFRHLGERTQYNLKSDWRIYIPDSEAISGSSTGK